MSVAQLSERDTAARAFGRTLARLRKARGWTQKELARQAGVGYQSVAYWENGSLPSPIKVEALARALDVPAVYLMRVGEDTCES